MTAPVSRIDFHNFGKYYFYKVKSLRACMVIQIIAALLSYPMAALVMDFLTDFDIKLQAARDAYYSAYPNAGDAQFLAWRAMEDKQDTAVMLIIVGAAIAVIALVTVVFMHFMVPLISYRRLYKKGCADMDYSLPVSADGAFWGDFLAGATVTVLPHLFSVVLGLILIRPLYGMPEYVGSEIIFKVLENDVFPLLWTVFLAAIMLYVLTIFIMGFCGKVFHAVAMPILVNIVVPVTHYLLNWLGMSFAAGNWSTAFYMGQLHPVFVTSPLGMALSSVMAGYYATEGFGDSLPFAPTNYYPIQQPQYLIPALIVILLLVLGAWLVIRRRRAEQVGARAFAARPAQYIIHGSAALMIAAVTGWQISRNFEDILFAMDAEYEPGILDLINAYSVLLLLAIPAVYLILEVAAGEARRFGWSLARCGGTTIAALGITLAAMCSNAFGAFLRAPDPQSVGTVHIYATKNRMNEVFTANVSERENIELITRLQNSAEKNNTYSNIFVAFDRMKNDPQSYYNSTRMELEYYTYDGHIKAKDIEISDETYSEILRELALPEVMADKCLDFHSNADEILGTTTWNTVSNNKDFAPLSKSGLTHDMISEAVKKDCENVTFERMFKCESGNYIRTVYFRVLPEGRDRDEMISYLSKEDSYFSSDESGSINVYPWFESTLKLLKEYGIEVDFGVDPDKYKTAFIVKSLPMDDGYERYQCYSGLRVTAENLFGLAGDEHFADYYRASGMAHKWDPETGEEKPMSDSEIMEDIKSQYQFVQAAKIDVSQAMELYPLCGSVYDVDTDYESDHYMLVLTNVTGEDIANDPYTSFEHMALFIPAEHFDKAAEMFDAADLN